MSPTVYYDHHYPLKRSQFDNPPDPTTNPDILTLPGNCSLSIWANSQASWEQRVTIAITQSSGSGGPPVTTSWIFEGSGEGVPMKIQGGGDTEIDLDNDPAGADRRCSTTCEYQRGGVWGKSLMFRAPPDVRPAGSSKPKKKRWTIWSEDGGGLDRNDSQLIIEANDFVWPAKERETVVEEGDVSKTSKGY
jgi:hypothetical protein